MLKTKSGFTIVELLIVIVVIAILAAISIVAYNGIQTRAKNAQIDSDLNSLQKAIASGQHLTGKTLHQIVNSGNHVGGACSVSSSPSLVNTDLSTLPKTHSCWVNYVNAITAIETASGATLSSIKNGDPYGQPYYMDQNEQENPGHCIKDIVGTYKRPLPSSWSPTYSWVDKRIDLPFVSNC